MTRKILLSAAATLLCSALAVAQTTSEVEITENQYGRKVESVPLRATAQDNYLVFENKDRGYKLWFDNRIHFDAAHYFGMTNGMLDEKGNSVMKGGVSLRRVRMAVKAEITKDWYGEIDVDFTNGEVELKDAYITYSGLKGFAFTAGNFKEDFSMERTTSSRYIGFMERAMVVHTFAPGRHAGVKAQWHGFDWLRASIGASWQAVDNADTRYNVEEFNKEGKGMGTNFTGKVVYMPWATREDLGMHIGYNASYRSPRKTDDDRDGASAEGRGYDGNYFSSRNSTNIHRIKYMTAEFGGVSHDVLQGFELGFHKGGFRFNGEFILNQTVMDKNAFTAEDIAFGKAKTKNFYGWFAQASYLLFGGQQRYDYGDSEFTRPTRGRKWGDVEVMARYDYLTLNSEDIKGGSGENYTLGVVFHVNNNVKIMANYQYSQNDRWANYKGRASVGLNAAGQPTKDPRQVVSQPGLRFSALQTRIEMTF